MSIQFKVIEKVKEETLNGTKTTITLGFPDEHGTIHRHVSADTTDYDLYQEGASYTVAGVPLVAHTDPVADWSAARSACFAACSAAPVASTSTALVPAAHPAVIAPDAAAKAAPATPAQVAVATKPIDPAAKAAAVAAAPVVAKPATPAPAPAAPAPAAPAVKLGSGS